MGIYIFTGPSGVGKTAVINGLLQLTPNSARLVSTTTRKPGHDELDGRDYFFVNREEFEDSVAKNEFLEYEDNYGNYYGTSRIRLNELLANHASVFIGGIDTRGARSIKKALPSAVTIFLLPDSMASLRKRLERRKRKDNIEKRLAQAVEKINQAGDFDYRVTNREGLLDETITEIMKIIQRNDVFKESKQ